MSVCMSRKNSVYRRVWFQLWSRASTESWNDVSLSIRGFLWFEEKSVVSWWPSLPDNYCFSHCRSRKWESSQLRPQDSQPSPCLTPQQPHGLWAGLGWLHTESAFPWDLQHCRLSRIEHSLPPQCFALWLLSVALEKRLNQSAARTLNWMFATSGKPGVNLIPSEPVKYQKAAHFLWAAPHPEIKRSKHSVKYTSLRGVGHSQRLSAWQGMEPQDRGDHGRVSFGEVGSNSTVKDGLPVLVSSLPKILLRQTIYGLVFLRHPENPHGQ